MKKRILLFCLGFFLIICGYFFSSVDKENFAFTSEIAMSQEVVPTRELFVLSKLPYSNNALEPFIDAETVAIHHDKHHAKYVDKLNETLQKYPQITYESLPDLLGKIALLPESARESVRNNAGGHSNHSIYWENLEPIGEDFFVPNPVFMEAIKQNFGSFEQFKTKFLEVAQNHFGSGWAWLALSPNKQLEIITTLNQDSPYMNGYIPLLGCDLWEHAYYLKYQNRRNEYLNGFWQLINWQKVSDRYVATM